MGDKRKNTGDGQTQPAKYRPGLKPVTAPSVMAVAEGDVVTLLESNVPKTGLHCDECHGPLKPPVYQCSRMRHIACSECVSGNDSDGGDGDGEGEGEGEEDDEYECSSCTDLGAFAVYVQSSYLETLFGYTKVACPYKKYGCPISVAYRNAVAHADACACTPCSCKECLFEGSPADLVRHLTEESGRHAWIAHKITYGKDHWYVFDKLNPEEQCHKLLVAEEDDGVFILNVYGYKRFHYVTLVCVRNKAGAVPVYSSSVAAEGPPGKGLTVKVERKVVASCPAPAEWECELCEALLVHRGLLHGKQSKKIHLCICISKNQDLSA